MEKNLTRFGILKCAKCKCIGDKTNMTHFEKENKYIHNKCIEKEIENDK